MNGGYSELNKRVRQMKQNGTIVIDRDDLAEHVDLSEVDRESLEAMCAKAMASVTLYQNGFRSVIRGKGVHVDYLLIKNRQVLRQLILNANKSEAEKLAITALLRQLEREAPEENAQQMAFTEDESGNISIYQEMTKEDLIAFLREISERAS